MTIKYTLPIRLVNDASATIAINPATGLPVADTMTDVIAAIQASTSNLRYVASTYYAIINFTGATAGNTILYTEFLDISTNPATLVSAAWTNATLGTTLASAPTIGVQIALSTSASLTNGELRAVPVIVDASTTGIPVGASTSAKQDLQITQETLINTKLDTVIAKDFATQATLAALLAKVITAPATEAKQDALNAKDFATQATLAAIAGGIPLSRGALLASDSMSIVPAVDWSNSNIFDAFSRLRVSEPLSLFEAQFTYDLQPLLFEQIATGSGAAIAHDTVNKNAVMSFTASPTLSQCFMQSYECMKYQPGKSQAARITFNFVSQTANVLKFARYGDAVGNTNGIGNAISFENTGALNRFAIYSTTAVGNQFVNQSSWNINKMDGSQGYTLNITKSNHFVMDLQALYVGKVRVGFEIDGKLIYCHEFLAANTEVNQYIATANLPIQVGMTCSATVTATMIFHCCCVQAEGGQQNDFGYDFVQAGTGTAGNGVRAHIMSMRPKLLFNSFVNRIGLDVTGLDFLVTGANSIYWELVIGQAITGTTTFNSVNSTYSATEYNTAGTISGSPLIVIESGYLYATGGGQSVKTAAAINLESKYPLTLNALGGQRLDGTISLLATGIGGTSALSAAMRVKEVR